MHRPLCPRIILALSFSLGFACTSDDDGDDGATAPTTMDDDAADEGGSDDGAMDCAEAPPPQSCIDLAAQEIACDPSLAESEAEIVTQCACYEAELSQTAECVAALDAYNACVLALSCEDVAEPPCDDGDVIACEV